MTDVAPPQTNNSLPWRDVTNQILSCLTSADLSPGQVITTNNNGQPSSIKLEDGTQIADSLTQAMSAMEMMEPKMDASCTFKKLLDNKHLVQNFEDAKRLKLASTKKTETDQEILTVFDTMANYFSRFLEGDFYPNSMGSCVYNLSDCLVTHGLSNEQLKKLISEDSENDTISNSICILFRICAKNASDLITFAGIHEEEDFSPFQIFDTEGTGQGPCDSDFYCDKIESILKTNKKYKDTSSPIFQRLQLLITFTELIQYLHHILQSPGNKCDNTFARATNNYCQIIKNRANNILKSIEEDEKIEDEKKRKLNLKIVSDLGSRPEGLVFGFDPFMAYPDMAGGFPRPSNFESRGYFYKWLVQVLDDVMSAIGVGLVWE